MITSWLAVGNLPRKPVSQPKRREHLVNLAKKAGAIGAAQNMIGEVVHALVVEKNAAMVTDAFREVLPEQNIFVSKLDFQGARLVSGT